MTTLDAPFRFHQEENVSILILQPELNKVQWGEIDSIGTHVLNALANQPQPNVIVDLSELNYMGSAMVALIVRGWKATMATKGKLSVVCPHAGVKEVLRLASLDKHWAITETQDEARAAVGAGRMSQKGGVSGERSAAPKVGGAIVVLLLALVVMLYLINPAWLGLPVGQPPLKQDVEQANPAAEADVPRTVEVEEEVLIESTPAPEMTTPVNGSPEPGPTGTNLPETSTVPIIPDTAVPETTPTESDSPEAASPVPETTPPATETSAPESPATEAPTTETPATETPAAETPPSVPSENEAAR